MSFKQCSILRGIESSRINKEKFLDLWKDVDPDIAEVADAKRRLAYRILDAIDK